MGGEKFEGRTDLNRGIDGVVDLDGGLLSRLCVCLHRRRRRRVQDARCDERERRTRLARELPLDGSGLVADDVLDTNGYDAGRKRRDATVATFVAHRRDQLDLGLASHPYDSSCVFHPLVYCSLFD